MGKEFEAIQFINDIFTFVDNLDSRAQKLKEFKIFCQFEFYHPGAILDSVFMKEKFNSPNSVVKDDYYIFYNLLTENFIFLEGSKVTQIKVAYPNDTLLGLVSIKGKSNYILHQNYVIEKIMRMRKIREKITSFDENTISKIFSNYYLAFKDAVGANFSTGLLLLNTTYNTDDLIDAEYFVNSHLYTLLTMRIKLSYFNHEYCKNKGFHNVDTVRTIVQAIAEKFYSYQHLSKSIIWRIYPEFISNSENEQCCTFINISFELNEPLKFLLLIEALEVANKV